MLQPEQGTFSSGGSLLQLPVLNLGLPMAASTQLADFFHCGGSTGILKASHYECDNEAAGETDIEAFGPGGATCAPAAVSVSAMDV